jgi:hypothetical protein
MSYSKTELGRTGESLTQMTTSYGITLGTAMAISGAEPNRSIGYHSSRITSIFMAVFDVRAGWWIGNPRFTPQWRTAGPTRGLGFSELLGLSDQNKGYVYLSDGGHFDNLGVYELLKRRCKLIVACDAELDGQSEFEDLAILMERATTNFGAHIEIDFSRIRPKGGRASKYNFAVGDIFYDPQNPKDRGKLFYVKASMPSNQGKSTVSETLLPDYVWRYYEKHKTFPHQSTADLWFDELQFESYRALGQHIGRSAAVEIGSAIKTALGS